jgi:hypothetical protein
MSYEIKAVIAETNSISASHFAKCSIKTDYWCQNSSKKVPPRRTALRSIIQQKISKDAQLGDLSSDHSWICGTAEMRSCDHWSTYSGMARRKGQRNFQVLLQDSCRTCSGDVVSFLKCHDDGSFDSCGCPKSSWTRLPVLGIFGIKTPYIDSEVEIANPVENGKPKEQASVCQGCHVHQVQSSPLCIVTYSQTAAIPGLNNMAMFEALWHHQHSNEG